MSVKLMALFLFTTLVNAQKLEGEWQYRIHDNQLDLVGGQIRNQNKSGRTGALKLALYVTRFRYNGSGSISGYVVWEKTYDPLRAGYYYKDLRILNEHIDSAYEDIPDGHYHATLCLLEYKGFRYIIVDHINFNGQLSK